jgi:flavin-dependent dehydrogenase
VNTFRSVETADAVVVGGGPAGAAAAITLARLGRRVVMIDKASFPRDKCCGDGLTTAALRHLEGLGLDPATVTSWQPVGSVAVATPMGRIYDFDLPGDGTLFAATACRRDLDAALVDLAERSGVHVLQRCPLTSVAPERGGVSVGTSDGRVLVSSYVIAADGMWSPTRRALGLSEPAYLGGWQAGRQYFRDVGPDAEKLWIWFEPEMVPGYAWSFPLPGRRANVGYAVVRPLDGVVRRRDAILRPRDAILRPRDAILRPRDAILRPRDAILRPRDGEDGRARLKGGPLDLLARPRIAEILGPGANACGPWRSWPIPTGIHHASLSALGGRVLFTGDAAKACDPMTGEGIAQALDTGVLAGRAVAAAGPTEPADAARRYVRRVRSGLSVDQRLSEFLSRMLAHPGGSDRALAMLERNSRFKRAFARWMFEDYPRAVLVTPKRWKRHLLSGPGAYATAVRSSEVTDAIAPDALADCP